MAVQDSGFIALSATGSVDVLSTQVLVNSGLVSASGSLSSTVSGKQTGPNYVHMFGTLSAEVNPEIVYNLGTITMSGTADISVAPQVLVNSYVSMYGFLTATVNPKIYAPCFELITDFNTQVIESVGCSTNKGSSVALKRYRGDTYPVAAILSKNGDTDITGFVVKLSTQITGQALYTSTGIITNGPLGYVEFDLDPLAIATAGTGVYDIQVDDGTYIYTYEKGEFELLDDLTP